MYDAANVLVDLPDISNKQYQVELAELQNVKTQLKLYLVQKVRWHGFVRKRKSNTQTQPNAQEKAILPFPSSFLAECGFSAVNDLLIKKINRQDITQGGDLRLKLTILENPI
ncbi:hypothetical protein TNCV_389221 [Trichonephila clavipes]|nr:hypothetical protein TNCV_389221 [Trichonephila clavipes]